MALVSSGSSNPILDGQIVRPEHVKNLLLALNGSGDSDVIITGSLNSTNGVSFVGTSSWAVSSSRATSASLATTASYVTSSNVFGPGGFNSILSASYALSSSYTLSSSFATTASFVVSSSYATTASFVLSSSYALSSSFAQTASFTVSSSFATSASRAQTASLALTASFVTGSNVFGPFGANSVNRALSASYVDITSSQAHVTVSYAGAQITIAVNTGSGGTSGITLTGNNNDFTYISSATSIAGTPSMSFSAGTGVIATGSFRGPLAGTASWASNAVLATSASTTAITTATANSTFYVHFGDQTSGHDNTQVDTDLSYNPSTNILTAPTFSGNLTGTSSWANSASAALNAVSATSASVVSVSSTNTNGTYYMHFGDQTSGVDNVEVDTSLNFNPSTNILTSPTFSGLLQGTASVAVTASYVKQAESASYISISGQNIIVNYTPTGIQLTGSDAFTGGSGATNIQLTGSNNDQIGLLSGSTPIGSGLTVKFSTSSSITISSSYALSSSYAVTSSIAISASYAISASHALSSSYSVSSSYALSASYALKASTSSLADTATTADKANQIKINTEPGSNVNRYLYYGDNATGYTDLYSDGTLTYNPYTNTLSSTTFVGGLTGTASWAQNFNTSSLLITASATSNTITFTKGNGTQFSVTVAGGTSGGGGATDIAVGQTDPTNKIQLKSGSSYIGSELIVPFATTASHANTALLTASVSSNTITFTKGNGDQFSLTVATGSGGGPGGPETDPVFAAWSASTTSQFAGTSSYAITAVTSSYPITVTGSSIYSVVPRAGVPDPTENIWIGTNAGNFNFGGAPPPTSATYTVFVGSGAGQNAISASNSVFVGRSAGMNATTATESIFLGMSAGRDAISAENCIIIGYQAGYAGLGSLSVGRNNIILGTGITLDPQRKDSINIGGVIFGTGSYYNKSVLGFSFSGSAGGRIGINVVTPTRNFEVSGSVAFPSLTSLSQINAVVIDTASGQLYYLPTSSFGVGGGGGGDITGVTAGDGMSGGGASGDVTLTLNTGSTHFTTGVGKLAGGSDTQIQFKSGSGGSAAFSGSSNFTFDYINNIAKLTGSLIVTGSSLLTGSLSMRGSANISGSLILSGSFIDDEDIGFNNTSNNPAAYQPRMVNLNSGANAGIAFYVQSGPNNISGSRFYINPLHKGYVNPGSGDPVYYRDGMGLILSPASLGTPGDTTRSMKYVSAIAGTSGSSTFEWHYFQSFNIGASSLKMRLDVPSGRLSNSGSIVTSGSLTIASGSTNTVNDCSFYFGNSGSNGSWRFNLSNGTMSLQAHDGSTYVSKQQWTA
jgi:hypothetical protein